MILFFDGFDMNRDPQGTFALGLHDFFGEWSGAVAFPGASDYIDGLNGGQALRTFTFGAAPKSGLATQEMNHVGSQYRWGMWIKGDEPIGDPIIDAPTTYDDFIAIRKGNISIRLAMTGNFTLRLEHRNSVGSVTTVLEQGTAELELFDRGIDGTYEGLWKHVELVADFATGSAEVWVQGQRVMHYTSGFPALPTIDPNTLQASISAWTNEDGEGYNLGYDHVYLATGTNLSQGQRYIAVAPTTSASRLGGDRSFRGFLMMNGVQENHPGGFRNGTGQLFSDYQYFNTLIFPFATDPRDGSDWNATKFNEITGFGFCTESANPNIGTRFTSMALYVLEMIGGFPYVTVRYPSNSTQFNGIWEKSNDEMTYFGHVQDLPRTDPDDPDLTDEYLDVFSEGCIAFGMFDDARDFVGVGLTFAEEFDPNHEDWASVTGGDDYESYLISGYKVNAEGDKQFQSNYVTINYQPEINGGAFFQGVWDYATTGTTGRWGTRQQVVQYEPGYAHKMRKLKVRGNGRVLQFRLTSEPGKPFRINGWTVFLTANQAV